MDNQPINLSQPNTSTQKNSSKYFFYGLEFLIPFFLLTLIFFLLNYLNILQFGRVFPILSFLPHLATSPISTTTTSPSSGKRVGKPSYTYNLDNGYSALDSYTKEVLQDSFRPLQQHEPNQKTSQSYTNMSWFNAEASASATISYVANTNNVGKLNLFISPKDLPQQPLTTDFASSEMKKYFTNLPGSAMQCKTLSNNFTVCEQFSQNTKYKEGFGVIANNAPSPASAVYFLFSCRIFPAYSLYNQTTTCLPQHK